MSIVLSAGTPSTLGLSTQKTCSKWDGSVLWVGDATHVSAYTYSRSGGWVSAATSISLGNTVYGMDCDGTYTHVVAGDTLYALKIVSGAIHIGSSYTPSAAGHSLYAVCCDTSGNIYVQDYTTCILYALFFSGTSYVVVSSVLVKPNGLFLYINSMNYLTTVTGSPPEPVFFVCGKATFGDGIGFYGIFAAFGLGPTGLTQLAWGETNGSTKCVSSTYDGTNIFILSDTPTIEAWTFTPNTFTKHATIATHNTAGAICFDGVRLYLTEVGYGIEVFKFTSPSTLALVANVLDSSTTASPSSQAISYGNGYCYYCRFSDNNIVPLQMTNNAVITATPTIGVGPLTVTFGAA